MQPNNALARLIVLTALLAGCSSARSPSAAPTVQHPIPRLVLNTIVTDSQVYRRRDLGSLYRYGSADMRRDVFIYPKDTWPDVQKQASIFIQSLEFDKRRRQLDSYEMMTNTSFNLAVGDQVLAAHEVTLEYAARGERHASYFAVVSFPDIYAKFRISRPVTSSDTTGRGFVEAWANAYLNPQR